MKRSEIKAKNKEAMNKPEEKARRSVRMKEVINKPEVKAKHKKAMNKAEVRTKISIRTREAMNRPKVKAKHKAKAKEVMNKSEVRELLSVIAKKRYDLMSYEEKLEHSETGRIAAAKYWDSLTFEERQRRMLPAQLACNANPSSIELAIADVLDKLGIDYEPHKLIGAYIVDLYLPDRNLVVECDGDYWHSLPGAKKHDRKKDRWLRK